MLEHDTFDGIDAHVRCEDEDAPAIVNAFDGGVVVEKRGDGVDCHWFQVLHFINHNQRRRASTHDLLDFLAQLLLRALHVLVAAVRDGATVKREDAVAEEAAATAQLLLNEIERNERLPYPRIAVERHRERRHRVRVIHVLAQRFDDVARHRLSEQATPELFAHRVHSPLPPPTAQRRQAQVGRPVRRRRQCQKCERERRSRHREHSK